MAEDVVVLVIRHPDHPTEIYSTHDVQEIIFDLGGAFDITSPQLWDEDGLQEELERAHELHHEHIDDALAGPISSVISQLQDALDFIRTHRT